MKRVALIQNRLQFGGRFQVAVHMIKALNDRGIVPDFYCFSSRFTPNDARNRYDIDVQFNIKTIARNYKIPFEWNIILFNKLVGKYVAGYDLVINHNNTSFMYDSVAPTISYVHYPRKDRMIREDRSIHFEGEKRRLFDIGNDALMIAHKAYKRDHLIQENDLQVANSEFTKEALKRVYPSYNKEIRVIYPPVDQPTRAIQEKDESTVVSLGRFSPDKRQDEQIDIAAKLPKLKFVLMGFINSPEFYSKCEKKIKDLNLTNVKLLGDAPKQEVDHHLNEAKYFIHSLRNEPFGITAVQAIQAGCIPIVHDSGGQKEVVPMEELRYADVDQAIVRIKHLLSWDQEKQKEVSEILIKNCHQFDASTFASRFNDLIDLYL